MISGWDKESPDLRRAAAATAHLLTFMRLALGQLALLCLLLASGCATHKPTSAAIASAHPLATQAGLRALDQGGNAFDAAVATAAVLSVVEPYSAGLGGGGFWLLYEASKQRWTVIDARETAPLAAHRDMYLDAKGNPRQDKPSVNGPLAAGIPGQPAAFAHIVKNYGHQPLSAVLRDAVRLAQQGFRAGTHYQRMAEVRAEALRRYPASAQLFLANGKAPASGSLILQPQLARTLYLLGLRGHRGFYEGEIAQQLVEDVKANGGIWSLEDLANYQVIEREPIHAWYPGDVHLVTVPPPSSGGVALVQMLNILHQFDWRQLDPLARTHLTVETMKLAYRDRAEWLGDADFVDVPVNRLTSLAYGAELAKQIDLNRAMQVDRTHSNGKVTGHTTHLSVIDRQGNMVAATLSINLPFGSAYTSPRTGVLLNNEMDDFVIKPGVPNSYGLVGNEQNSIAPGKRPLSSMTPTIIETPERVAILGTPGGSRIISMVLLASLDMLQGRSPESWVQLPRFHHQYLPDEIQFEPDAISPEHQQTLEAMGHRLKELDRTYGNMQAILWHRESGKLEAASDPRGEGQAISR